jgi:hypothetical protein
LAPLLAEVPTRSCPLGAVAADHPCLWGERALLPPRPLLVETDARLLPTRRTGQADLWWTSRKQGGLTSQGEPIEALTDFRGQRPIYPLPAGAGQGLARGGKRRSLVLYGGTLFEHFGHLLLDLSRLYRLLPLFRRSREPIWFHYPALKEGGAIDHPLVLAWLDCLGIRKRARVVRRSLHAEQLVSSPVLYRDRCFVTQDFPRAAQRALAPKLSRRLQALEPASAPIAYLSRHKLTTGTTCFEGEAEVVEALGHLSNVDVICPEELSIEAKLGLYRRYGLVTGFVQAAMLLKYFVPPPQAGCLAEQLLLVAGPHSLNSNWVNLETAYGFGDRMLDCSLASQPPAEPHAREIIPGAGAGFQRQHRFNVGLVVDQLRALAGR